MKEEKIKRRITNYPPLQGSLNTIGMYPTDPMGSYTGRPVDVDDEPVQDADDL